MVMVMGVVMVIVMVMEFNGDVVGGREILCQVQIQFFFPWNESGFPRWLGSGVRSEVQEDLRLCLKQFLVLSF